MANKAISELTAATSVGDNDLFVLQQGGEAKKLTGSYLETWLLSLANGHGGISTIQRTSQAGLVDTYTITYADNSTSTFTVTNGANGTNGTNGTNGVGISSIALTGASGLVDEYTITFTNGTTFVYYVTNGANGATGATGPQGPTGASGQNGVSPTATISKSGNAATITITDANGTTSAVLYDGTNGANGENGANGTDGTSAYVYIRYSSVQPTQDSDMGTIPDAWMGIYAGSSATAPTHYTDYTWYEIKGATGATGQQGPRGYNGEPGAQGDPGNMIWTSFLPPVIPPVASGQLPYFDLNGIYDRGSMYTQDVQPGDVIFYGSSYYYVAYVDFSAERATYGEYYSMEGGAVPQGGTTGQVLAKASNDDYDVEWVTGGGGTSDYSDLTNKPQVNSVTLSGNKSLSDLGITSPTPEIAWLSNISTSAEVEAAYQAGLEMICVYQYFGIDPPPPVYLRFSSRQSATLHIFTGIDNVGSRKIAACNNDTWTISTYTNPTPYDNTPENLGTASAGVSDYYARGDHVHAMPSASDVGAIAAPSSPSAGDVLKYSNGAWGAAALSASDVGAVATPTETALTGTTPTIASAADNTIYTAGEVTSLTVTSASASISFVIIFTSGSTATNLSMPNTIVMPDSFSVEANKRYEINVRNGYAVVQGWTVSA